MMTIIPRLEIKFADMGHVEFLMRNRYFTAKKYSKKKFIVLLLIIEFSHEFFCYLTTFKEPFIPPSWQQKFYYVEVSFTL